MLTASASTLKRAWARPADRAFIVALLSVIPLLIWWLGWFPGFMSSDSFDQLGQARDFEFRNAHPALHTFMIWMVTRVWDNPGAVTLVQLLAMSGILALAAKRLAQIGVPWRLAAGTALLISLIPSVSTTTISMWKDVPYTIALVWAFTEVLVISRDRKAIDRSLWPLLRLGIALGLVWMLRHNGFLTVVPFLVALVVWARDSRRRIGITVAGLGAVVIATNFVLYPILDVDRAAIEPGAVFISDVAASLNHEPGNFSTEELKYLETIAPLALWDTAYECHDSTALVFDGQFHAGVITADPGAFRELVFKTYLRDPDTVLGHRWCAADYLLWPPQPAGVFFQRPPFVMADNRYGIAFDPIFQPAFDVTLDIVRWTEDGGRIWFTWRPALAVWLAIATYAGIIWRRRLRVLGLAGVLLGAQIFNVAATTPAQEFRFAFGIYVIALLSAPLLWLVVKPQDARLADPQGRALRLNVQDLRATTTNSL